MQYESLLLQPMRDEVTRLGASELRSVSEVEKFMTDADLTALVFVNSVCGCAAGNARPSLALALGETAGPKPARVATVFAGQDVEATERFRAFFPQIAASSPAFYLIKSGEVVKHVPRQGIEGRAATAIARDLETAFSEYC
jgi:putative YphP/YqiW family bacilliredoxin